MTKQDYEKIARVIRDASVSGALPEGVAEYFALEFAKLFKQDNARFNKNRFLDACGVPR